MSSRSGLKTLYAGASGTLQGCQAKNVSGRW